jgi:heme/copper-type cytochrome/quinol oxidase subunit 3
MNNNLENKNINNEDIIEFRKEITNSNFENQVRNEEFEKEYKEVEFYPWEEIMQEECKFKQERQHTHYFNDIPFTMWPLFICVELTNLILYGLFVLDIGMPIVTTFFLLHIPYLFAFVCYWFNELVIESMIFGKYNRKLRSVIIAGMMLFLASEVFLFGGFFWAFFDRLFHPSSMIGSTSVPLGIEVFVWYKKPLYATLILLFSAIAFNGANYCMKWGSWTYAVAYSTFGLLLGCIFLIIQVHEYKHLSFTITDTVFGSSFYLLTGFHGCHVIIGLIFLTIQHERLVSLHFSRERHLGYSLAMIYWHFVDIVWIFLFLFVYVFNFYGLRVAGFY